MTITKKSDGNFDIYEYSDPIHNINVSIKYDFNRDVIYDEDICLRNWANVFGYMYDQPKGIIQVKKCDLMKYAIKMDNERFLKFATDITLDILTEDKIVNNAHEVEEFRKMTNDLPAQHEQLQRLYRDLLGDYNRKIDNIEQYNNIRITLNPIIEDVWFRVFSGIFDEQLEEDMQKILNYIYDLDMMMNYLIYIIYENNTRTDGMILNLKSM